MVKIYLLGKFDILVDEQSTIGTLENSRRGRSLLAYLLLHRGQPVPNPTLGMALWQNAEAADALKALISRTRTALESICKGLGDCIATSRGAYGWNPDFPCEIDIDQFDILFETLLKMPAWSAEAQHTLDSLMMVYRGDLVMEEDAEGWLAEKSKQYHQKFLRAVAHAIRLLKEKGDYEEVISIARRALDVDAFDEMLRLELMEALVKMDRSNEVFMQYRQPTPQATGGSGIFLSNKLQNLYRQIIHEDQALGIDIESIRRSLTDEEKTRGALVCDYMIFKDIYQLMMRNLARLGCHVYLGVMMISSTRDQPIEPLLLDRSMHHLLDSMVSNLRRGDTVTRYSPSQYALLLPSVNHDTGRMVMERIRNTFYQQHVDTSLSISYKLTPVEDDPKA